MFRVWGSRAFVRDTSADKLSARAIPCVFLGFVPDAPGWQFYHPTSRRILPSQDVTFDESVPFYRLFPYRSAPPPPPPLFLAPGPPLVDPLQPQGPAPSGVSQVDPLLGPAPVQVAVVSGAAPGTASGGAASGGAEPGGAGSEGAGYGGADVEGAEPGGAESEGAESGGAEPWCAASSGGPAGASPRLSSQQLRELLVQRAHHRSGAPRAGEPGDARAGGTAVTTEAGDPTEPRAAGAGGVGAGVAGVGGPGAGGTGAAGVGDFDPGAGGTGGTVRPRPYFIPLLHQVLGVPSSSGLPPPFLCPPPDQSQPPLKPASPLRVPSPYTEQSGGLTERCEPASRPVSPVRTARRAPRLRPPLVPGTHTMALRPSSVPLRVPLTAPPKSSLPEVPDPESNQARAASPTVARLLATAITNPCFESTAASSLVAELLDFAAACRLDYASALVAESVPASPPSVGGECALGTDVLEDRQEDFECLATAVPCFASLLLAPERDPDAPDILTPRSHAEAITGPYSSLVKRPVGSPPTFKARYVALYSLPAGQPARGDLAAPTTWFHWDVPCRRDITALTWILQRFGFQFSSPQLTPLSTSHLLSAPPSNESVEPSGPYPELVGCLITSSMGLVLGGQGPVVLTSHADASWVDDSATQRSSQGYTFSLGSGSVSWRSTCSSSVLKSSCEAEIYARAMAAQELRWLTYLLTDLGEQPRSPPVLNVDNKAMIALCQEHRLEHRTKHIALRYFIARELQQRGQLRLAYVAIRANTADVFTKALPLGGHQRFFTMLGLHRTAQALYDALVARYSSPATAALGRLLLPYLFPELSAFTKVEDLVSHLRASDARYCIAVPHEFLDRKPPPMDHFLSLDPTSLTVDLLEQHLLAAKTCAVAVGAACGTPRPPFFEGYSPSPLAPSYASAAAAHTSVPEDVGSASASAKRRRNKGKGGRGGGGGSGSGGGGSGSGGGGNGSGSGGSSGGGGNSGTVGGSGGSGSGGGGSGGSGGSGGDGTGGGGIGARRVHSGSGQRQQQQRRSETLSPQQLREWFLHGASGGSCPYVIRTGDRAGQTCGRHHTQHRCFSHLDNAWRAEFGDDVELPSWADLLMSRIAIFDLDFDAILSAMYALSVSAEGDCYRCVPPDPGIAAAALGASDSGTLPGTAPAEALHTFKLDSSASRYFFRNSTTLTPLPAPIPVRLADPSGGPVVARSSTVLPCPAVPSSSLSGLHLPLFSMNLRVSICTCTQTGHHLATFTRRPGSSLYTLTTEPSQVAASCSCRLLSLQTLLWHHRLGHPSLPRLRCMHSPLLVSGLPRSLPPLLPLPAPPCLSCIDGRQRAAPHSSSFPPTTAPLQTLHMDVWGPARVSGQSRERYFLLVVDNYMWYTMFQEGADASWVDDSATQRSSQGYTFSLGSGSVSWRSTRSSSRGQLHLAYVATRANTADVFTKALPPGDHQRFVTVLGLLALFFLTAFVRDTSADKLSSRAVPCVFLGFPPDAPGWQFYHPTSRHVLSSHDVTFDESVSYYHHVKPVEVAVDSGAARGAEPAGAGTGGVEPGGAEPERVEPVGAEPGGAESGSAEPGGAEPELAESGGPLGVPSRQEPLSPQRLREWYARHCCHAAGAGAAGGTSGSGAAGGGAGAGAAGAAGPGGTGAVGGFAGVGAAGGAGAADPGGARTGGTGAAGAGGASGFGAASAGAVATGGTGAGGAAGVVAGDLGAEGTCAVSAISGGAVRPRPYYVPLLQQVLGLLPSTSPAPPLLSPPPVQSQSQLPPVSPLPGPSPYSGPRRDLTERRSSKSRPLSIDSRPSSPESCSASPVRAVRTGRRVSRPRPSPVPGTHSMTLHPSNAPQRVPLPSPPASSLPDGPDPEFDSLRAANPTATRFLATAFTDPLFESCAACALVAKLVEFAATCHLDYATSLVAESASASVCPRSIGDIPTPRSYAEAIEGPYSSQWQAAMDAEMASWKSTGTYIDKVSLPGANIVTGMWIFRVKRPPGSPPVFKARYVARGFCQRQGVDFFQTFSPTPKMTTLRVLLHVATQRVYELHSLEFSTAFLQGSLHEEIWLRRPPGFTGMTLAALCFAPSTADPSLFLRTDATLPPFYVLVYANDLVFATADTEALAHVKSELQKRQTCTDLGELTSYLGLRITRDRAQLTITLTQSHIVQQVLQRFDFTYSSPQSTPLPTGHSLSAPPSDESIEPSGPYPELVGCLMFLMTCTRPDLAYPLSLLARYVAPGRHRKVHWDAAKRVLRYLCSTSGMGLVLGGLARVVLTGHADASWVDDLAMQWLSQGYTFSLGYGSVSWRSTHSSSVLSFSCEAEIYVGAMAAQELRWLTYLLSDLGEVPRSPPVLYVDNKAMLALCQEHKLEHRTKHILSLSPPSSHSHHYPLTPITILSLPPPSSHSHHHPLTSFTILSLPPPSVRD
ncbi:unnamed protein product [Closterium sp. NIES-53]